MRCLLILTKQDVRGSQTIAENVQVMQDQKRAGVAVVYALRQELAQSVFFQRLAKSFKTYGGTDEINTALFDEELLLFSRAYQQVTLGLPKAGQSLTHIDQLQITWKPDHLHHLNPLPLFDMTCFVSPFRGEQSFRRQITRWKSQMSRTAKPRVVRKR